MTVSNRISTLTRAALLATGLTLSVGAFAASSDAAQPAATASGSPAGDVAIANMPNVVANIAKYGAGKVLRTFPAAGGMTGWVLQPPKNVPPVLAFSTPDGQALVVGTILDANGKALNNEYNEKYVPKPEVEKALAVVEGATGSAVKSTVYVFADPMCVFCNMLYRELLPYEKVGLQVRYVLVGILKQDSAGKAAAIYQSANPVAALNQHEMTVDALKEVGGIPPVTARPEIALAIKANTEMMGKFGFTGTPGIVFKDASGKLTTVNGFARPSQLPGLTHLPEQLQTDPALTSFLARMGN